MKNLIYITNSKIANSNSDGKGIFADSNFKFKDLVYQPKGKIVNAESIDWDAIGKEGYDGFLQIGGWDYFDGRKDAYFKFLNHSCNPNLGFKNLDGKVSFVAIKPISKNKELTFDYSTTMFEELDEEPMPCICKSKNCRKIIRDFRFLPKKTQEKYIKLGIVPDYVLDECSQEKPMLKNKAFQNSK
ncbi:MAG: SET domain-containing protein-lysine N-methyltransferase [Nanoarchaeota archaeon]